MTIKATNWTEMYYEALEKDNLRLIHDEMITTCISETALDVIGDILETGFPIRILDEEDHIIDIFYDLKYNKAFTLEFVQRAKAKELIICEIMRG